MSSNDHEVDTQFSVPVTVWLPHSVFRPMFAIARKRDVDVGELIAERLVIAFRQRAGEEGKRRHVRMTPARLEALVEMFQRGEAQSVIARELGVSQASVSAHIKRLNLSKGQR